MFDKDSFMKNWKERAYAAERVPDGTYKCTLKEIKEAKSPGGCNQLSLQWITDADENPSNRSIWQNINTTDKTGARSDKGEQIAADTLNRMGVNDPEAFLMDRESVYKGLRGTEANIKVVTQKDNPQFFNVYLGWEGVKSTLQERISSLPSQEDDKGLAEDEVAISEGMIVNTPLGSGEILTLIPETGQVLVDISGKAQIFDLSSIAIPEDDNAPFEVKSITPTSQVSFRQAGETKTGTVLSVEDDNAIVFSNGQKLQIPLSYLALA